MDLDPCRQTATDFIKENISYPFEPRVYYTLWLLPLFYFFLYELGITSSTTNI